MLKKRIIPTLLWKDMGLVKGVSFNSWRRIGTVLPAIKVYNMRQVDELIIVDILASEQEREPDYYSISEFSAECFVPLTVGGGIKNVEEVKQILRSGADKVTINTALYNNLSLISCIANTFGSQCIVASIDAKKNTSGQYECYSYSGKRPMNIKPDLWAKELEKAGAGEILITSIDNDGTMQGYDIELIKSITDTVNIPVIASGGAGNYFHMFEVINKTAVDAIAAASIFHFTEQTPIEAKEYLSSRNIPVRKKYSNTNV